MMLQSLKKLILKIQNQIIQMSLTAEKIVSFLLKF